MFLVFELLGYDLDQIKGLPFSNEFIFKVIDQLTKGLEVLHQNKITHCDIKPDNILITKLPKSIEKIISEYRSYDFINLYKTQRLNVKMNKKNKKRKLKEKINKLIISDMNINDEKYDVNEQYTLEDIEISDVRISDFGLFCVNDEFYTGSFGTLHYLAPESLLYLEHDHKIDIWALGCTIYELISGIILFEPPKDEYDRKYHHFYKIQRLIGKIPKHVINMSKIKKKYFSSSCSVIDFDENDCDNFDIYFKNKGIDGCFLPFFRNTLTLESKKRSCHI
jgi:serine/threonine protein kinase